MCPRAANLDLFASRNVAGDRSQDHDLPGADFGFDLAFLTHGQAMVFKADVSFEMPFNQQILACG